MMNILEPTIPNQTSPLNGLNGHLIARIGNQTVGLPLAMVQTTQRLSALTCLPSHLTHLDDNRSIMGIGSWQGFTFWAVSLGSLLDQEAPADHAAALTGQLIVLQATNEIYFGLVVDELITTDQNFAPDTSLDRPTLLSLLDKKVGRLFETPLGPLKKTDLLVFNASIKGTSKDDAQKFAFLMTSLHHIKIIDKSDLHYQRSAEAHESNLRSGFWAHSDAPEVPVYLLNTVLNNDDTPEGHDFALGEDRLHLLYLSLADGSNFGLILGSINDDPGQVTHELTAMLLSNTGSRASDTLFSLPLGGLAHTRADTILILSADRAFELCQNQVNRGR